MTLRFEALPVGRGDAFLLRDGELAFLFDGGQYYQQAAAFLKDRGVSHLDAVVCSHNDSDHATGIIGVLESSVDVSEVWVPAVWHDFIAAAAHKPCWPHSFLREVMENPAALEKWSHGGFIQGEEPPTREAENQADNTEDRAGCIGEFLEALGEQTSAVKELPLCCPHVRGGRCLDSCFGGPVWVDILRAGDRIIKILGRAWNKGCSIRCFRHATTCDQRVGGTGFIPLNSRGDTGFRTSKNIESVLFLTVQNRESLVFKYANGRSSVVFTADSDLESVNLCLSGPAVVTAPHHGSADNASAFDKVRGQNLVWVRSDCRCRKRPCSEYKKTTSRYCTICNAGARALVKQPVLLSWNNGQWQTSAGPCTCQ